MSASYECKCSLDHSDECDERRDMWEKKEKAERNKKRMALMLPPVLESVSIHELDPYLQYTCVMVPWVDFGTIDKNGTATGWTVWTNDIAMLCGRYPDSICVMWRGEVMTVRSMIKKDGINCMPTKAAAVFSAYYRELSVLPVFDPCDILLPNEVRVKAYYCFSVTGDSKCPILVTASRPFEPQIKLSHGGKELCFQYKEGCVDNIDPIVACQVYAMYFSATWKKPRFTDEDYYSQSSYAMWTLDAHVNQIDRVLAKIPANVLVVAPGDGIGVVARQRKYVIAGDLYVNPMTHPLVFKESITSTILRGLEREAKEKIFILSYITKFMTADDWDLIKDQRVIIIDANQEIRSQLRQALRYAGPGVVTYGVPSVVSDVWEFRKKHVNINYTENLLNIEGFDVETDSPALMYILTMAPGKQMYPLNERMREYLVEHGVVPRKEPTGVRLVNVLRDLKQGGFFTPLGKYVTANVPIVDVQALAVLPYRQVLRTPVRNKAIIEQLGVTSYSDGSYYFFYYDKEEEKEFPYVYVGRTESVKGKVKFGNVTLSPIGVICDVAVLYLYTVKKTYMFGLRNGFVDTDKLDQIEDVNMEIINSLLQYVPLNEKQMWQRYGQQTTGWAAFKRKFAEQERRRKRQ